jgi:hypothetical protein
MSSNVAQFVTALSQNPQAMENFSKDPDGVMEVHDLTDEDREILKSGDAEKIRAHCGDEGPPGCLVLIV